MEWLFNNNTVDNPPKDAIGFIYKITNLCNGRMYIGKKLLTMATTKQINGKKKKARKESKWREYNGSNQELLQDIKQIGQNNIKKEILEWTYTDSYHNYCEIKYQFKLDVLENVQFYNDNIGGRYYKRNYLNYIEFVKEKAPR